MSRDELDELFGEEEIVEDSLAIADSSNDKSEASDGSSESEEENDGKEEHFTNPKVDELNLPSIQRPADQGFIPYVLKLPGFVACKRGFYNGEATLKDELIETDFCDYGDLLRSSATIRNRRLNSGEGEIIETNSRLNRWSDGSWTLQIGSEHFEILPQSFSTDENNILFIRHQNEGCLEAVGKLGNKLTLRPFMDSQGSHRKYLALAEATGKGMKKVKVRVATTTADPETEKRGLVKIQQERIKARRKLDAKRRNLEQKSFDRVGREGLTARFLEADEDDEVIGADEDEYDADFIDDGEIEDEIEDDENEEEEEDDFDNDNDKGNNDESSNSTTEKQRSKTSRLIFDDDDDD